MPDRQVVTSTLVKPRPWQIRLLTPGLTTMPLSLRRAANEFVMRRPPDGRLRPRVLGDGIHVGWTLLNAGRFEALLNIYDPDVEILWTGERKPFDMPDRFKGHSEALDSFGWMHQLASSGVESEIRPIQLVDAGGPCVATHLEWVSTWNRSDSPMRQGASTVYTLAGGRVIRQVLIFDDRVDLEAELAAALDRA